MSSPLREAAPSPSHPHLRPRSIPLGAPAGARAALVLRAAADAAGLSEVRFGETAGLSPSGGRSALASGEIGFARVVHAARQDPSFARALAEAFLEFADEAPVSSIAVERHALTLGRETGRVCELVVAAQADGVVDEHERAAISKQAGKVVQCATRMQREVRAGGGR